MSRFVRLIFCVLLLFAIASNAQPLDYYVAGMAFSDGGAGSGSFTFDSSLDIYSNVRMVTTPGSVRTSGATYFYLCGQDFPACNFVHDGSFVRLLTSLNSDQTGGSALLLQFLPPLSGIGFAETVRALAAEADCGDPACMSGISPDRLLFSPGGVAASSQTLEQYLFFGS